MKSAQAVPSLDLGGMYRAQQHEDGTWTIFDVPIMGPLKAGDRSNLEDVGASWMRQCVKNHKVLEQGDTFASVHIYHHDDIGMTKPIPAGFIRPKRVERTEMIVEEGASLRRRAVPTIISDLIKVPNKVYQMMSNVRLPFRSPEVIDWSIPRISSLALLPTEEPFFNLPMLTINEDIEESIKLQNVGPAVAFSTCGNGGRILFRMERSRRKQPKNNQRFQNKGDGKMPENREEDKDLFEIEDVDLDGVDGGIMQAADEGNGNNMAEDIASALQSVMAPMMEKMDMLLGAAGIDTGGDSMENDDDDDDDNMQGNVGGPEIKDLEDDDVDGSPFDQKMSGAAGKAIIQLVKHVGKLSGEMAAMRSERKEDRQKSKLRTRVDAAKNHLKGYGLTEEDLKDLHLMAAFGDEALKAHVKSYKRNKIKDPAPTFDQFEQDLDPQGGSEHEALRGRYAQMGPDMLEKFNQAQTDYYALRATRAGGQMSVSLEKFVEINMAHANGSDLRRLNLTKKVI